MAIFLFVVSATAFANEGYDKRILALHSSCKNEGRVYDRTSEVSNSGVITIQGSMDNTRVNITIPKKFFRKNSYNPFNFIWHVKFEKEDVKATEMVLYCDSKKGNVVDHFEIQEIIGPDEDADFADSETTQYSKNDNSLDWLSQLGK